MKIKGVILDNDQNAVTHIKTFIDLFEDIEILEIFDNAINASQFLSTREIDVIFVDINLSLVNGISFIKNISPNTNIIVTTKLKELAIDCFEYGVLDFLVKPITLERFLKSINRLQKQVAFQIKTNQNDSIPYLFIKEHKRFIKININDIVFIESQKDYIKITLVEKSYLTLGSLSTFCEELPEDFIRVHRSFCISKKHVDAVNGNIIELKGSKIPIGRNYIKTVKSQLLSNTFQN